MKHLGVLVIVASLGLSAAPTPSEAGWLKWLIKGSKQTTKTQGGRKITREVIQETTEQVAKRSKFSTALSVGNTVLTGATVVSLFATMGYAENPVPELQAEVEDEFIHAANSGQSNYQTKVCEWEGKTIIMPSVATTCLDGSPVLLGGEVIFES